MRTWLDLAGKPSKQTGKHDLTAGDFTLSPRLNANFTHIRNRLHIGRIRPKRYDARICRGQLRSPCLSRFTLMPSDVESKLSETQSYDLCCDMFCVLELETEYCIPTAQNIHLRSCPLRRLNQPAPQGVLRSCTHNLQPREFHISKPDVFRGHHVQKRHAR